MSPKSSTVDRCIFTFTSGSEVYSLAMTDNTVYGGCQDAKIRVWNLNTMQKSHMLIGCAVYYLCQTFVERRSCLLLSQHTRARPAADTTRLSAASIFANRHFTLAAPTTKSRCILCPALAPHLVGDAYRRPLSACKVWDLKSNSCTTLFGHQSIIRAVAVDETGQARTHNVPVLKGNERTFDPAIFPLQTLYSGADDKKIKIWQAR